MAQLGRFALEYGPEVIDGLAGLLFPASGARTRGGGRSASATPSLALDYRSDIALSAPAANGTFVRTPNPKVRTTSRECFITHREYVQDIIVPGGGMFDIIVDQPINPGNATLFPWLSSIANNYETYSFDKLDFIFEPQSSTGQGGTIMIAVDYDAVDLAPVSKTAMMNYKGAVQSPPWFACVYHCEPSDLHKYKQYYMTQSATTPTTTDEKTYFVGNIYLAANTAGTPEEVGGFYIEYTVRLFTPQVNNITPNASLIDSITVATDQTSYAPRYKGGTLDIMYDWGDLFQATPGNSMDIIIPRPGSYLVTLVVQSTSGAWDMETDSPPAGFTETSQLPLLSSLAAPDGYGYIAAFVNLQGPLWFQITRTIVLSGDPGAVWLTVTPFDQGSLEAMIPYLTPSPLPTLSKVQKFKRRIAGRAVPRVGAERKHLISAEDRAFEAECHREAQDIARRRRLGLPTETKGLQTAISEAQHTFLPFAEPGDNVPSSHSSSS